MFLQIVVKLNNSILVQNFGILLKKFKCRPKYAQRRILVLSQSGILDLLLPSGFYWSKNQGSQTYFAPTVPDMRGQRPLASPKSMPVLKCNKRLFTKYFTSPNLLSQFKQFFFNLTELNALSKKIPLSIKT